LQGNNDWANVPKYNVIPTLTVLFITQMKCCWNWIFAHYLWERQASKGLFL